MKKLSYYLFAATIILLSGCTVIRMGEVALDVHRGRIKNILDPGPYHPAIFGKKIIRFDARILEYEGKFNFHTNDGIEINSEISLTYHLIPDSLKSIYTNFGTEYQNIVIIDNLTTVIRSSGENYKATELLDVRSKMEEYIKTNMNNFIRPYGFEVDLVLIKHIELPQQIVATIEAKLNALEISKKTEIDLEIKKKNRDYDLETQKKEAELEIIKQRLTLDFVIEKQKKEAERLLIESEAIKKQQDILNSTLTDKLLKLEGTSNNCVNFLQ